MILSAFDAVRLHGNRSPGDEDDDLSLSGAAQKVSISTPAAAESSRCRMGNSHATTPRGAVSGHYSLALFGTWWPDARIPGPWTAEAGGRVFGLDKGVENTYAQLTDVAQAPGANV